jgi:glucuronate isomerase
VARYLSGLVTEHMLSPGSATEIARHLSYQAAKDAYRL